VGGNMYVLNTK